MFLRGKDIFTHDVTCVCLEMLCVWKVTCFCKNMSEFVFGSDVCVLSNELFIFRSYRFLIEHDTFMHEGAAFVFDDERFINEFPVFVVENDMFLFEVFVDDTFCME